MSTLDRVRALFPVGCEIEVIEQTLQPHLVGTRRRVLKAQRRELKCETVGGAGEQFWMSLPTRVRQVLSLDGSSVRFKMPQNEEHTLAFRRVTAAPGPPTPPKPPSHRPVG